MTGNERGRGRQRSLNPKNCCGKSTLDAGRDWLSPSGEGADGDIDLNRNEKAKTKQKAKDIEEKKIARFQHSGPSSSSSSSTITTSTDMEDNNECGEQGATSTAIPVSPGPELTACLPVPIHSTSYSISSSSSSSLSSLSSSVTPSPSVPLVPNSGDADADADVEYGTQQVKNQIRELKMRFLKFRDELERIIGRLEVLDGGEDGDLGKEGVDEGLIDHPNLVSRASRMKSKRKRKDSDLDIEMIGIVESGGAILDYVDAAVGVDADALVALRDVSAQTADANSAIPLHSTDDLSNVVKKNLKKIKPTLSLKSKTDESNPSLTQFVNTSNFSAMVDNLVSIKMLSMMQTLVKSSVGGNSNGKAKLVEPSTANANAATTNITKTTTSEPDSDLIYQPSSSSSSVSISTASHSRDACDSVISSLLEDIKTIKQEARCREQSEKEDLLAMRQLHSAEVDALRRRLSYLESRTLSPDRWDLSNGGGASASGRWKASRVDDSLEFDRHRYRFFEDSGTSRSFRQQQYGDRSQAFQQNGLIHYSSRSASIVNPEGASTSTNTSTTPLSSREPNSLPLPPLSVTSSTTTADSVVPSSTPSLLPTPPPTTLSDKHYSSGFSKDNNNHYHGMGGMDLDDDTMVNLPLPLPLPIKSQRKHHIMTLTRAQFS